jgi:MoaA/NifB/PqqE/SkfB family radical SAM enzyme
MNWQTLQIVRILLNPRITARPLRVLHELRRRGIRRVPEAVDRELQAGLGKRAGNRSTLGLVKRWLDGEMLSRHRGQWVLNSFLPPFPGPAFNRMFENLLSGRHLSPVSAFLAITASCPNRCWHCSMAARRQGDLTSDAWRSTIRGLHGLGASIVGFTGGEPLSRGDLPELVAAASGGGAATIVFSSGALLSERLAAELKRAGLWAFCVSLDHSDPREHDRLRGKEGAYARALAAVRLARRAGFYTMISSVATRSFVEAGMHARLYETARGLKVHEYRIVEPMPCGKLSGVDENALLVPAHVQELRRFHVDTNRRGRLPKVCAFNQVESPDVFGCGGGTQHLYIDSAGEVCPCDFTPLSFGNVTEAPLEDIWARMNRAMGDYPRAHCFIQKHHRLIQEHAASGSSSFPLSPEESEEVCAEAGPDELPGFFRLVTGGRAREPREEAACATSLDGARGG